MPSNLKGSFLHEMGPFKHQIYNIFNRSNFIRKVHA